MSEAHARQDEDDEAEPVILTPEEEEELVQRIAETDESRRAGRLIPLEAFLAERGMG